MDFLLFIKQSKKRTLTDGEYNSSGKLLC